MLRTSVNVQPRSVPKNSHACAGRGVIMLNQQNSPGFRTPVATDDETTFRKTFSTSMTSPFFDRNDRHAPGTNEPGACRQPNELFLPVGCGDTRSSLEREDPCSTLSFVTILKTKSAPGRKSRTTLRSPSST